MNINQVQFGWGILILMNINVNINQVFFKIGIVDNNWLVGWLVRWSVGNAVSSETEVHEIRGP